MTKKPEDAGFDVSIFEPISSRLLVKHPVTGEPIPEMWIDCVGPESEEYRAAARQISRRNLNRVKFDDQFEEADYQLAESRSFMASLITGWNEDKFGPFNKERVKEVLQKYVSLTAQIDAFIAERKNFFRTDRK